MATTFSQAVRRLPRGPALYHQAGRYASLARIMLPSLIMLALFFAYIAVQVMLDLVAFAPEDEPVKTVPLAEKLPEFVAISVPEFR